MEKIIRNITLAGTVQAPPSKSDAQRAILIAALTDGKSIIVQPGTSEDVLRMIENMQKLGAQVFIDHLELTITGVHAFHDRTTFNAGESGLGFRLLTALSAVAPGSYWIDAEGSLLNRKQNFIIDTLKETGCQIEHRNGFPPFNVLGKINRSIIDLDASDSSQFLSGLLIALPLLNQQIELKVQNLRSTPYVHMTLNSLSKFGVQIQNKNDQHFVISANSKFTPTKYTVEGDWSGTSNWFVAAALGAQIEICGLNPSSLQADTAILKAMSASNCLIHYSNDVYKIDGRNKRPFEFDATQCPDLFPALIPLAASCIGVSRIQGVHRLRNKESDRAFVLLNEYKTLGLDIVIDNDTMIVYGTGTLNGGKVHSNNDHRIAMSLAISSLISRGEVVILDCNCVNKSYPDFWSEFDRLIV